MNPIVDGIMVIFFILFMIFVFGGYHKNKSAQREAGFKKNKENCEAMGHEEIQEKSKKNKS